jgi:hypothetical protein
MGNRQCIAVIPLAKSFPAWGTDRRDECSSCSRWGNGGGQVSRFSVPAEAGGGVRQLSGTKVMPDFCTAGAAFPGTGGTTVRPLQVGHGICRPEYCSSHSRCCPQWEQLNLNWLIKSLCLTGTDCESRRRIRPAIFSWGDRCWAYRVLARVNCPPRPGPEWTNGRNFYSVTA